MPRSAEPHQNRRRSLLTSSVGLSPIAAGPSDRTCGANETIYCVKLAVAARTGGAEKMRGRGAFFSFWEAWARECLAGSARTPRSSPTGGGGCDIDMCVCRTGGLTPPSVRPSSASMGRRGSVAAARLIVARRPRRYQRENLRSLGRSVCGATFTAAAAAIVA